MPRKAKIPHSQYEQLFSELSKELTSFGEVNAVLERFGERFGMTIEAVKSGAWNKALWRHRKINDDSWIKLCNKNGFGGESKIFEEELSQFPKHKIISWLNELIGYKENDSILEATKNDSNDEWYLALLGDKIMEDMKDFDFEWKEHRKRIHRNDTWIPFFMGLFSLGLGLSGLIQALTGNITEIEIESNISMFYATMSIAILGGLVLLYTPLQGMKIDQEREQWLIERTEKKIMNKYPKELLNHIYATELANAFDEDFIEGIDYDFAEIGLYSYLFEYKPTTLQIPYQTSLIWKLYYRLSGVSLVDVETWKQWDDRGQLPQGILNDTHFPNIAP